MTRGLGIPKRKMSMNIFEIPDALKHKACSARAAAEYIKTGMLVAASGYTNAGDPKATLKALAEMARQGIVGGISLLTAAQLSPAVEDDLVNSGLICGRTPFSTSRILAKGANESQLDYAEIPLDKVPRLVANRTLGVPDIAVIEVIGISETGEVTLSSSVGITPLLCDIAKKIIVEINTVQPEELYGIHDIYSGANYSGASLEFIEQRKGSHSFRIDVEKICAIVESGEPDEVVRNPEPDKSAENVIEHLQNFLDVNFGPHDLPPVQTGIGTLARAVTQSFYDSKFQDIKFYCGALQADMIDLVLGGKASFLSGGALEITETCRRQLALLGNRRKEHLVLRGMEMSNGAAAVASMNLIAINTGIECDIFGNVNSTHINGSKIVNGIGGGPVFMANAGLSILLMPSVRKNAEISCFVPHTPHVDVNHHSVDVIISDQGVADLRGKDDVHCAKTIIRNCVHPDYRDGLLSYLSAAKKSNPGHHPVDLDSAFSWYRTLRETGSMK